MYAITRFWVWMIQNNWLVFLISMLKVGGFWVRLSNARGYRSTVDSLSVEITLYNLVLFLWISQYFNLMLFLKFGLSCYFLSAIKGKLFKSTYVATVIQKLVIKMFKKSTFKVTCDRSNRWSAIHISGDSQSMLVNRGHFEVRVTHNWQLWKYAVHGSEIHQMKNNCGKG